MTNAVLALENLLESHSHSPDTFAPATLAKLDMEEAFPQSAIQVLNDFGLHRYYIPEQYAGRLTRYDELIGLWRVVSRRDLTVAIAHGKTFLGAICTWIAGNTYQINELASIMETGAAISWGLTERNHGGDLLSGELEAIESEDGWILNGEKWLINNATRGQALCILARTEAPTARGFSLFLVDKEQLKTNSYYCLPKEQTHGIRGADISGISFKNTEISKKALIGDKGAGIEVTLKALQITRTLCAGLSLGAADQALRLVLPFARQHQLYGQSLITLASARRMLGEACTMLVIAEAVSFVASRSIHSLTAEMSVVSAIAKAFVPTLADDLIAKIAELMGARAYLTTAYADGMFQKLERDHRIVAIFDGSTVVNRSTLINQFPLLAKAYQQKKINHDGVKIATSLHSELPSVKFEQLTLLSSGGCSLIQNLPDLTDKITDFIKQGIIPDSITAMLQQFNTAVTELMQDIAKYKPTRLEAEPQAFILASRYEWCFAGAAALHIWIHNMPRMNNPTVKSIWQHGLWLEVSLSWIIQQLDPASKYSNFEGYDRFLDQCLAIKIWKIKDSLLFSYGEPQNE